MKIKKLSVWNDYVNCVNEPNRINIPVFSDIYKLNISEKFNTWPSTEISNTNDLDFRNIIISIGDDHNIFGVLAEKFLKRKHLNFSNLELFFVNKNISSLDSVMFILDSSDLTMEKQQLLVEYFQKEETINNQSIPFGVITGKNLALTSYHLMKNIWLKLNNQNSVFVQFSDEDLTTIDGEHIILSNKDSSISKLQDLKRNGWIDFLTITSGTVDDFTFSKQEVICGKSRYFDPKHESIVPQCELGYECLINRLPLKTAADIPAKVMLLQGCSSSRLSDSTFGANFDIGYSFLESDICAYIGTPRLVGVNSKTEKLFSYLLSSGYKLGECTMHLNNALLFQGIDVPAFILYGDPQIQLRKKESLHYKADVKSDSLVIKTQNTKKNFYSFEVKKDKFEITNPFLFIKNKETDYNYFILEDGENNKNIICVVFYDTLSVDTLEICLLNNGIEGLKKHIQRLSSNFIFEKYISNLMKGLPNIANEIQNSLLYIVNNITQFNSITIANLGKFESQIEKLENLVTRYQGKVVKDIMKSIKRNGFNYDGISENNTAINSYCYKTSISCESCGANLSERIKSHVIYPDYQRVLQICPQCSNMYEFTHEKSLNVQWNIKNKYSLKELNHLTVKLENISGGNLNIVCGIELNHTYQSKESFISPNFVEILLEPNETYEWNLDFSIGDMTPHIQKFTMIILADFDISVYKNNFIPY